MYISGIRKHSDVIRRRFIIGVSLSFRVSSSIAAPFLAPASAPFTEAPYPAASTAAMISDWDAVPSTPMEFVRRLTEQLVTPDTFDTAFSTLLLHAAQLIPVTVYCSTKIHLTFWLYLPFLYCKNFPALFT